MERIVTLPYVKYITERIQRILSELTIRVSVRPVKTLKQILSKPKDRIPMEKRTGVVYQIPCKDCNAKYIGETGRSLETRLKEHKASVRLAKCESSALADHANSLSHDVTWEYTCIARPLVKTKDHRGYDDRTRHQWSYQQRLWQENARQLSATH